MDTHAGTLLDTFPVLTHEEAEKEKAALYIQECWKWWDTLASDQWLSKRGWVRRGPSPSPGVEGPRLGGDIRGRLECMRRYRVECWHLWRVYGSRPSSATKRKEDEIRGFCNGTLKYKPQKGCHIFELKRGLLWFGTSPTAVSVQCTIQENKEARQAWWTSKGGNPMLCEYEGRIAWREKVDAFATANAAKRAQQRALGRSLKNLEIEAKIGGPLD